jgi:ppGpp synthetase/RelA/SpoT-type nucleotidyltranferase
MKELQIENRIALLKSRVRDNENIVKKLERKQRKLQKNKQN